MKSFRYVAQAQEVIFGDGAVHQLPATVEAFGWQRLLLCSTPHLSRNGHVKYIQDLLGAKLVAVYAQVEPHVPDYQLAECLEIAESNNIDAVIGLGGGSPIGMAKAVSFELEIKRRGEKSASSRHAADQPLVPSIAIPTTYAGSEMTPVYGVTRIQADGSTRKATVHDYKITPKLTIYDPSLTVNLPPDLTASTGINALAHCIEAIYSRTRNPLSTASALFGIRYIMGALVRCFQHPDDMTARTEMFIGAHMGGMSLATVEMGVHHGTCQVLGGTAGVPHGIANCIILPHAIRYNSDQLAPLIARAAEAMGIRRDDQSDEALSEAAAEAVYQLVGKLRVPQRLHDVITDETLLLKLAENMLKSKPVNNNPKPLTSIEDAMSILNAAW